MNSIWWETEAVSSEICAHDNSGCPDCFSAGGVLLRQCDVRRALRAREAELLQAEFAEAALR